MRNMPHRNPFDSYAPELFERYSAHSKMGILIRQGDARLRVKEMLAAEEDIAQQERETGEIADRLARMNALHELSVQYLLHYGVTLAERHSFQAVLEEVGEHGDLTLAEAAGRVHEQQQLQQRENAPTHSKWMESVGTQQF